MERFKTTLISLLRMFCILNITFLRSIYYIIFDQHTIYDYGILSTDNVADKILDEEEDKLSFINKLILESKNSDIDNKDIDKGIDDGKQPN